MKKLIITLMFIASFFFVGITPASAKIMVQEKGEIVVAKNEVIDDDLFIGAETVQILGTVNGSVYVGAGMVNLKGNVKGDVVVGTGKVNLSGNISGDIYVGAGDINISEATIGGSVIAVGGNVVIDKDSKIGGSLLAATGNLQNSASVGRNMYVGAGNIYLNNRVGKEARLGGGQIELGAKAVIGGDLTYALKDDTVVLKQDEGSTVSGTISRYTPPAKVQEDMTRARDEMRRAGRVVGTGFRFISFVGTLIFGLLLLKLFPKTSLGLTKVVESALGKSIGIGLLIAILTFPVLLVLAITIIGLPVVGILIPILIVEFHLAKLISSLFVGQFVAKQFNMNKMNVYMTFFVGLMIFYLLRMVPVIGWFASMFFTWAGLGAIWLYTRSHLKTL